MEIYSQFKIKNMKAKSFFIIALAALLFCSLEQEAQTFTTGIDAGVSVTSVKFSDVGQAFTNAIQGKNIIGFEGGLFERINLGPIFIKPMLLASYQSGTINFYNLNGTVNSSSQFDYGKIEVPVLLGIKLFKVLRVEGGPVYNCIYTKDYDYDNKIKINPSGLGYRIGANVEFKRINLGFAYQGLTNKSSAGGATFTSPNELIFSIGYCFGGVAKVVTQAL
jgi:hypothetical protein